MGAFRGPPGAFWGPLGGLSWTSCGPLGGLLGPLGSPMAASGASGDRKLEISVGVSHLFFIWRLVARMLLRVSAKGLPMDVLNNFAACGTHRASYFYNTLPTCLRSETNCTTSSILRDANSTCPSLPLGSIPHPLDHLPDATPIPHPFAGRIPVWASMRLAVIRDSCEHKGHHIHRKA